MLYIQDPTFEDSKILLDTILECCREATLGGGAYAYASSDGAKLLIGDPVFKEFLSTGKFELIIGIDDITNTRTLATLRNYCDSYDNLRVHVFLHDTEGSRFHPKFCWFDCGDYGLTVTGSGNLTQKGMQRNREVFEYSCVSTDTLEEIKNRWTAWLKSSAPFLKSLDNKEVQKKAEENASRMRTAQRNQARLRRAARLTSEVKQPDTAQTDEDTELVVYIDDEIGSWKFDSNSKVLVAEIPKGGSRWNQANFDAETFRDFFESVPGVTGQLALTLRDVKWNGTLGDIKHRTPVSVSSQNYRIELYVERGISYPDDGRVLGVFIKLSSRTYLYMLVFPDNMNHNALQLMLDTHRERQDRLVRHPTDVEELMSLCPDLPILDYLQCDGVIDGY